ncbi:putative reverse transcriptase domain-containing protein [Tanacetum coccineum]
MIRQRDESPSTSHPLPSSTPPLGTPLLLPIPLPTSSPPLLLPSTVCRAGVFEVTLPPRKRLYIALGLRYKVGKSSSTPTARPTGGFRADYGFVATLDDEIRRNPKRDVGYGITDTYDDMVEEMQGTPTDTDVAGLSQRMTNFVMTVRQDTYEIYGRLDDAQDDRVLMSGYDIVYYSVSTADRAWSFAGNRPRSTGIACGDTETDEYTTDIAMLGTGIRRQAPLARECTYPDCMKCKTLYFKGTKGVFELTQWFERMGIVFRISNCIMENQIKFATCTFLGSALIWWNSHVRTVGHDVAYEMIWTDLKKKMTDKYCPRGEIKKHEVDIWDLKVKGTNVVSYNQRFQELALMCARLFPEEMDKIEKYVGGLPDMIHGSVKASKPKTTQDAIEFVTKLMDKKISTFAERQADNKRKFDDTSKNNQNQQQQQQNKGQNTVRAYTAGSGEKKPYGGSKPL